jgi:hypothetical protein
MTCGPRVLVRGDRERIPIWSCPGLGRGPLRWLGQNGSPRPFILFPNSFPFSFLFSDLIQSLFANFMQTNSNKVLNYSNILSNVLNQ